MNPRLLRLLWGTSLGARAAALGFSQGNRQSEAGSPLPAIQCLIPLASGRQLP